MVLNIDLSTWHGIFKLLHSIISVTLLLISFWVIMRSVQGVIKNKAYKKLDKFLSFAFIVNLYLQLIFGLILFSNLGSSSANGYQGGDLASDMVSKRLWPIEHIVLMLFALFIANLGLIISIKSNVDRDKHQKILIYYMVSLFMIALSLSVNYFF
jgi:heme A synthase